MPLDTQYCLPLPPFTNDTKASILTTIPLPLATIKITTTRIYWISQRDLNKKPKQQKKNYS